MNILFVCTGNICRSAMAEYLLRKKAEDNALNDIIVKSCGTSAASFGVLDIAVSSMEKEGIDITKHKPQQVSGELVNWADLILVMENAHKRYVLNNFNNVKEKTHLLKSYIKAEGEHGISDPYGSDDEHYLQTVANLKTYIDQLIVKLKQQAKSVKSRK